MKLIKKSRWIKTFLAAILIISMTSQSLTAYAVVTGTEDSGLITSMPNSSDGNLLSGEGWLISIQEVENTATNVAAGSTESEVSFDNAWLHDFPSCYYSTDANSAFRNPEKYAFIGNSSTSANKNYYVANPDGSGRSSNHVIYYKASSGSGNFSTAAQLLENSKWYDDILTGLKNYSLTSEYVIYAANNSSISLSTAKSAFVKLWQNSGSVDDAINDFVFSSDDYWEQAIRYLDLLIIVNAMCNNAWSNDEESTDYIQYYLDHRNADGSEKFVAVVVAAVANCATSANSDKALMTLPVYYKYRTGQSASTFASWDGSGDWSNIQSSFNDSYSATGWKMTNNNTNSIWWTEAEMATSVYPVGSDGSLGFCGYTYIAPTFVPDPDDIIEPTDSSNPSSSPSSSVAATDVVTPTFTVEVTTENEYMQRDTSQPVTATVTIDMGQTDAVQKTFKNIYTSLKNSGESYKTAIEVFVERTFSDGSGVDTSNAVMDSDASGGYFASAVQPTLTSAVVYRWQGTDWDSGNNSSLTALPASPQANPRTTTTPPSRQTERSSFCRATSPSQGRQKM